MEIRKRKHQAEAEKILHEMATGRTPEKTLICRVTQGGGKSTIPIIAAKELIYHGKADKVCWVVPRKALQDQGERGFVDPFFQKAFKHSLLIRISTNDRDPSRGDAGFVTTYQAIGMDRGELQREFRRYRYILLLDEYHHVEEEGVWAKALAPLVELAAYRVLMTGSLMRGDGKKIAFTPYRDMGNGYEEPDLTDGDGGVRLINYSRSDALAEKAILPLVFDLSDGRAAWKENTGQRIEVESLSSATKKEAAPALFTALSTEFSLNLLGKTVDHWERHKQSVNSYAQLLVVADGYANAKRYKKYLAGRFIGSDIATSHESEAAYRAITNFKRGDIDALVTIAMAYEGLDVPAISHIAALTHIRSVPWIEQMLARAVRIDRRAGAYEEQFAYIFAPDDPLFQGVIEQIKAEQAPYVTTAQDGNCEKDDGASGGSGQMNLFGEEESNRFGIKPIESAMTDARMVPLDLRRTARGQVPLGGSSPDLARMETSSAIEKKLRNKINHYVGRFEYINCYKPGRVNSELKTHFGKGRADMTIDELKALWDHLSAVYPLNGKPAVKVMGASKPRGQGRKAPSKAQEWAGPVNVPRVPVFGG